MASNPPESANQAELPVANTFANSRGKRPSIRVLSGPLRLTSYRPMPIVLDASDPLVQESETQDVHAITLVDPQTFERDRRGTGVIPWTVRIKGWLATIRTISRSRRCL